MPLQTIRNDNETIETAIDDFYKETAGENFAEILMALYYRMHDGGRFIVPVEASVNLADELDIEHLKYGDTFSLKEDIHLRYRNLDTEDERYWAVVFTSDEEMAEWGPSDGRSGESGTISAAGQRCGCGL